MINLIFKFIENILMTKLVGFKSIRVAIFYAGLPKPNATLLLYPGLGPAMLRRLRRESLPVSIGGVMFSLENSKKFTCVCDV